MILEALSEIGSEVASSVADVTESVASSAVGELPSQVQPIAEWAQNMWNWLNEPLPIVGISIVAIAIFAWRFLATTSFGKKAMNKLKAEFEETKKGTQETIDQYRAEAEAMKKSMAELEEENEALKEALGVVCSNSRNRKVKDAMKLIETEETEDGEREESQETADGKPDEA